MSTGTPTTEPPPVETEPEDQDFSRLAQQQWKTHSVLAEAATRRSANMAYANWKRHQRQAFGSDAKEEDMNGEDEMILVDSPITINNTGPNPQTTSTPLATTTPQDVPALVAPVAAIPASPTPPAPTKTPSVIGKVLTNPLTMVALGALIGGPIGALLVPAATNLFSQTVTVPPPVTPTPVTPTKPAGDVWLDYDWYWGPPKDVK